MGEIVHQFHHMQDVAKIYPEKKSLQRNFPDDLGLHL